MKERLIFTLIMSFQLSLLMSFWVTWFNLGWTEVFVFSWFKAFSFAWPLLAMVISFMITPLSQKLTLKLSAR